MSNELPQVVARRKFLVGGATGALAALLSSGRRVMAEERDDVPNDPFVVLLKGLYRPVPTGHGPADNLGLSTSVVNLNDGSYARTRIYPVFGIPESEDQDKAIGTFYVSLSTFTCAYDLPGGALAMQFTAGGGFTSLRPDGRGGQYDEGTFVLNIVEATGVYRAFAGGHNHMVDKLHQLVAGTPFAGFPVGYNEFCLCNISQF
jgi:hypothetical protein